MAINNEVDNNELETEDTLEHLIKKVRTSKDGEDAEGYAKAYQALKEADTLEWREAKKLDVERQKGRWVFIGQMIGGLIGQPLGMALAAFIKRDGDLTFQRNAQIWEDEGHYVNYKKYNKKGKRY